MFAVGELIVGPPSVEARTLMMGAAWVINLGVAEWIIRGTPLLRRRVLATA
jgi:hypothetical protein